MRELKLAGQVLPVRATPIAMLFYRQEFGTDMTADFLAVMSGFISMVPGAKDIPLADITKEKLASVNVTIESLTTSGFDTLGVFKLVWAMAKAAQPQGWPSFESWLTELSDADEALDFFDPDFLSTALEVAADGLFRGAERTVAPKPRKRAVTR
jgi:hypothetical protein